MLTPLRWAVQDQSRTVRNGFAFKVHRTVASLLQEQHCNQRAAKYAAMLPLAGADPNKPNQQARACTPMVDRSLFSSLQPASSFVPC